jgi:pyridoxamine 5'-phosphate oxidase
MSNSLGSCAQGQCFTSASRIDMTSSTTSDGQVDIGRQNHLPRQQGTSEASHAEYLPEGISWRLLLERSSALARHIRGSNYVQLATVDGDGRPRCRTVVFRGFLPHHQDLRPLWSESRVVCDGLPCILKMTTDTRSRKVDHVIANEQSGAELVWWFPNSNEQFRIAGEVAFIGGAASGALNRSGSGTDSQNPPTLNANPFLQQERERMWKSLSEAARESFLTDAIPGNVYSLPSGESPDAAVIALDRAPSICDDPPDSFLLMLLVPHSVDYLRLTNMYRQVDTIDTGVWTNVRVNP